MLGLCLIGAGRAGMIHAMNFKNKVPGSKMVAVVDPAEEAAKAACKELEIDRYYLDYTQALEDKSIDAVVIVSPTKYHRDIAVAAANAGKHILCEKPMAMDVNECDDMIQAAEKNNVKLQIGFMRRYDESFLEAKAMIDAGEIGDVILVKSHTRGPSIPQPWMYDITKSNGPLAEVNSHDIDTIRWYTRSDFESLHALAGNFRCPDAKNDFPDFYDNVILNAKLKNGMLGAIDGAQGVGYGYDAKAEIIGSKGIIQVGRTLDKWITCCTKENSIKSPYISTWRKLFKDAYLEEDIHFIKCIREDLVPRVTGYDGKMAVMVVEAGNASIREKQIIQLKQEGYR